jgi:hypothetical protein
MKVLDSIWSEAPSNGQTSCVEQRGETSRRAGRPRMRFFGRRRQDGLSGRARRACGLPGPGIAATRKSGVEAGAVYLALVSGAELVRPGSRPAGLTSSAASPSGAPAIPRCPRQQLRAFAVVCVGSQVDHAGHPSAHMTPAQGVAVSGGSPTTCWPRMLGGCGCHVLTQEPVSGPSDGGTSVQLTRGNDTTMTQTPLCQTGLLAEGFRP